MYNILYAEISNFSDLLYKINNIIFSDQRFLVPGKEFIRVSSDIGIHIKNILENGNEVYIQKEKVSNNYDIEYDDLQILENTDLELKKKKIYFKIKNKITYYSSSITALQFYNFFNLYSVLANRGYFITEENSEDLFLKIATDDEDLVPLLEDYLKLKEGIDKVNSACNNLNNSLKELHDINSEDELETFKEQYKLN